MIHLTLEMNHLIWENESFLSGETNHLITNEAVQMHGGVGVTDEYDIGFFLKRARVTEQIFGSAKYHTERYANLSGF